MLVRLLRKRHFVLGVFSSSGQVGKHEHIELLDVLARRLVKLPVQSLARIVIAFNAQCFLKEGSI